MNKKFIIIGAAIILLIAGGILLSKKEKSPPKSEQSAEEILETAEKATGNSNNIVVPSDIKKVTDELRQKYQNQICEKEPTAYCEYYIEHIKKTGEKKIRNLEWNSLCALVRALGRMNSDLYEYETIGYEEKPCYQGMYKKK